MWTYLAIFFSVVLLGGVFLRRGIILSKKIRGGDKAPTENNVKVKKRKEKIIKKDQIKAAALCRRSGVLVAAGKEDEAIKCLVQALAIDPSHTEAQKALAMLYLQKQLFSAAAALFKQLGEATNDPVYYSHWGLALYQAGEFEAARDAYQKAVSLDDSRAARFVSLAHVYKSLGQPYNAVVAVTKALDLEKDNLDFLFLLADLHAGLMNWAEVKYFLKKILEIEPANKEAKKLLKAAEKQQNETV